MYHCLNPLTNRVKIRDDECMDPKQNAQLDPKLKEAYDRVMGTATPTTTPPPVDSMATGPASAPSPVSATPVVSPTVSPATPTTAPTPEPALPVAPVVMPHSTETVRIGGNTPIEVQHTTTGTTHNETKKGISPIIIILGAIVFLLVYSLFWIKFLNVPIPYINQ